MDIDFDPCSYSLSDGSIQGSKCDNYGALFCRLCNRRYCHDHACFHLNPYLESKADDFDNEPDSEPTTYTSPQSTSTALLRKRRDSLFKELKEIQAELDTRAVSELGPLAPLRYNSKPKGSSYKSRATRPKFTKSKLELKAMIEQLIAKGLLSVLLSKLKDSK